MFSVVLSVKVLKTSVTDETTTEVLKNERYMQYNQAHI